jgi:hypothetical protein
MTRPREIALTTVIALIAIPTHALGLLVPTLYRDRPVVIPQNLGTDLMTLALAIPVVMVAAIAMRGGSLRARVVWLGTMGYLVYSYGMYALGVAWNPLFLVYVALFGLSLFGFIAGLVTTDPAAVRAALIGRVSPKLTAGYLIAVAALVGALWLGEEIGAVANGRIPDSVIEFGTPTNIVHVFDLAVVLPAMIVSAVLLLRDRPWGFLLSGVVLVKATTITLWVLLMIWFSSQRGVEVPLAYTALFAGITIASVGLTWRYVGGMLAAPA